MLDLQAARRDTPGCFDRVFLDSAGSSLPPTPVLETMLAHLRREAEVGGYVAADERLDDLTAVKTSLGRLFDVPETSLALSDGASRAWTSFFYAVPLRPGDRILISQAEYAANAIAALQRARRPAPPSRSFRPIRPAASTSRHSRGCSTNGCGSCPSCTPPPTVGWSTPCGRSPTPRTRWGRSCCSTRASRWGNCR